MMEPRVQRLLKDARASVGHPLRPETPKEAPRPGLGRSRLSSLRSPVTEGERFSSPTDLAMSTSTGTSAASWAQQLESAASVAEQLILIGTMGNELRIIRPSEEHDCVALVLRLVDIGESRCASSEDDDVLLSIRAASAACRIAMNGASPSFSSGLVASTRLLQQHATHGRGAVLKSEMVLDSLIQLLRMQSSGWCRDAIHNAVATLRNCSSEGGQLVVHLATLGLLAASSQLASRVLPTKDVELLSHCAAIFRNFSADYPQHFSRLNCTSVLIQILELGTQMRVRGGSASKAHEAAGGSDVWREAVGSVSRALAKLVFDDECATGLANGGAVSTLVAALAAYGTSKMIVARLGVVLDILLQRVDDGILDPFVEANEVHIRQFISSVSSKSILQADTSRDAKSLGDDAVQSTWRLMGTLSICAQGGRLLASCAVEPLLVWLDAHHDRDEGSDTFRLALMALSNLTFYFPSALGEEATEAILRNYGGLLVQLLFRPDTESLLEATRALGNLSRSNCGCNWIEQNRCDEVCLVLAQHKDLRIVYNSFGVLLNLTAADHCRIAEDSGLCAQVLEQTGRYHLLDLSGDEMSEEAQVSTVVEKLLCNLSALV